jgi:hypothetical protein
MTCVRIAGKQREQIVALDQRGVKLLTALPRLAPDMPLFQSGETSDQLSSAEARRSLLGLAAAAGVSLRSLGDPRRWFAKPLLSQG